MPLDKNDPEVQAELDAIRAEVKAEADKAAAALAANNKKLLEQLREAKKGTEIDPARHAALEDKVAELESLLDKTSADAKKTTSEYAKQVETLTKQLQSENGFTQKLLVDNGLSDALVKAGVAPTFLPAVKAMLSSNVKIVAEGDTRKAVVGEKALNDFVTEWAQSDEGKHFVVAPANSGGGSSGGAGGGANTKVIQSGDKDAFGLNLEELAKGNKSAVIVA